MVTEPILPIDLMNDAFEKGEEGPWKKDRRNRNAIIITAVSRKSTHPS
jgi:hypothetical protein